MFSLCDVSMDIAVQIHELLPPTLSVTHGIELCECPDQYSSSSCQNPSIGYYRYYDNRTTAVSTIVIQITGIAAPCNCNGLSTVCETETGECLVSLAIHLFKTIPGYPEHLLLFCKCDEDRVEEDRLHLKRLRVNAV